MKLTIIPADSTAVVDGLFTNGLAINAPADCHALQWSGDSGWIEYLAPKANEPIDALPEWAMDVVKAFLVKTPLAEVPPYNPATQRLQATAPVVDELGNWQQSWQVIDLSGPEITAAQVALAEKTKAGIRAQIVALEATQLMPRATREFMLLLSESMATPEQLAVNPGYQAVKVFDLQIKELRDQLV